MKKFFSAVLAVVLSLGLGTAAMDAEAKRIGGGRSLGMQRQATPPQAPAATPSTPATAPAAAGAAAPKKNSWMGPLAGIAAGLGLAALASHFGFGDELASIMLIALVAFAVLAVVGMVLRKRAAQQGMAYAGAGASGMPQASRAYDTPMARQGLDSGAAAGSTGGSLIGANLGQATRQGHIPADFDTAGFERNAKVQFIRLQAANDAGNLDDIRGFTTPEMFAEIQMDMADRGGKTQTTEVVQLNAEVLDVAEEPALYIVSVRFSGSLREDGELVQINEVWHLSKPRNGATGWLVAGIQQVA